MEFTVSRADLVRELNLSQGVVEKKTTIPILSNVLVEADGGRHTVVCEVRAILEHLDEQHSQPELIGHCHRAGCG